MNNLINVRAHTSDHAGQSGELVNDRTLLRRWLAYSCLFLGLLVAASAHAESYRPLVKKTMKARLETFPVAVRKLANNDSVCGIGIQSLWNRTIVHLSDVGTASGLRSGDEILTVNGQKISDEPESYRNLIQQYGQNDAVTLSILRNDVEHDIEAICIDDSERIRSHIGMLQLAAKGKWKQCIEKSYDVEKLDGMRTLFSSDVRNTCTEAKRCGWKCRKPAVADARSLYEVNVSELEVVSLANVSIENVRASVLNGINWLEKTGYLRFAADLKSRLQTANSAAAQPVSALERRQ